MWPVVIGVLAAESTIAELVYTSSLYPVDPNQVDNLNVAFSIPRAYLAEIQYEAMSLTFSITGSVWREDPVYTITPVEVLDLNFQLSSGSLRENPFYTLPVEFISATFSLTSSLLAEQPIVTTWPVETLDLHFNVTSISLLT